MRPAAGDADPSAAGAKAAHRGRRWRVLAGIVLLLAGCNAPQSPPQTFAACRMRPDGPVLAERGIGGTGAPSASSAIADRGIGGTGVIGVITGFGSICLDGLEIAVKGTVPVSADGTAAPPDSLRAGQLAIVEAGGHGADLEARRIAVRHEVTGPIEAIGPAAAADGTRQSLVVAGQRIILDGVPEGDALLVIGNWISVSGLRAPGDIVIATRLDRAPTGHAVIHGRVATEAGRPRGVPARAGTAPPQAHIGAAALRLGHGVTMVTGAVTADGLYRDGVLEVRHMTADPFIDSPTSLFEGRADTFVIETWLDPAATASMPGPMVGDLISPVQNLAGELAAGFAVLTLQRDKAGALRATAVAPSTGLGSSAPQVPSAPLPAVIVPPAPAAQPAATGAGAAASPDAAPAASGLPLPATTSNGSAPATATLPGTSTPNVTTPVTSTSAGTAPTTSVTSPAAIAPITSPTGTTATVATPSVTTPVTTTPGVTTPTMTTPALTTPAVTTPTVTTPAMTTPTVASPTATTPAVTAPTTTAPAVATPTVTTPAPTTATTAAPATATTAAPTTSTTAAPSGTTPAATISPSTRTPSVSTPAPSTLAPSTPAPSIPAVTSPSTPSPSIKH